MNKLFQSQANEITRLILIRHGRTKKNFESRIGAREDSPLDSLGMEQAQKVADRLTEFPVSQIFSSPIKRTMQTAESIAKKFQLEIVTKPELVEYEFGIISGLTMDEVQDKYPEIHKGIRNWMHLEDHYNQERTTIPGAETFSDLENRVVNFTDYVVENYLGETVVAVTHLAVIKAFMATLFGKTVYQPMNFIAFNTSITVIDFLRKKPILMAFNDTRHLDLDLHYGKITPL